MNKYARTARVHWETYLPDRLAEIPPEERTKFFEDLGVQAQSMVASLTSQLAGPDPAGEGYLQKVGRLNAAKMQAEEIVDHELLRPAPSEDWDESDPVDPDQAKLFRDLQKIHEDDFQETLEQ